MFSSVSFERKGRNSRLASLGILATCGVIFLTLKEYFILKSVKLREFFDKGSGSQTKDYYDNIVRTMHVSIFGRNENLAIFERDHNVMYIRVNIILSLLKCRNVKSIHIELGKEHHEYSFATIVCNKLMR